MCNRAGNGLLVLHRASWKVPRHCSKAVMHSLHCNGPPRSRSKTLTSKLLHLSPPSAMLCLRVRPKNFGHRRRWRGWSQRCNLQLHGLIHWYFQHVAQSCNGLGPNISVNRTLTRYAGSRRLPRALGARQNEGELVKQSQRRILTLTCGGSAICFLLLLSLVVPAAVGATAYFVSAVGFLLSSGGLVYAQLQRGPRT